jgi:hypothetical protein
MEHPLMAADLECSIMRFGMSGHASHHFRTWRNARLVLAARARSSWAMPYARSSAPVNGNRAQRNLTRASMAAVRPAYGAECQGLGFLIVVMGVRLVGFAGGLVVLGGWTRWCVGAGGMCPSPALRSVQAGCFPTAFIRALVETGGAAHGLSRDVISTRRRARPVRSTSRGVMRQRRLP